ncbi:hypothetical protein D051_0502 [Vibrio parahaemolyticus VPCR-2010]|uniref:hypothetical protein n=1 Tax=Vibrio parahaemolyticus TaxID=670 RepID=UPI00038E6626|nr:hypothetical protein D051_0502 [Vibrio parahaemolyticus VPCR-2010]
MSSEKNINSGSNTDNAIDIEKEIQGITQMQQEQNRIKLAKAKEKAKKTHSIINIIALSLCAGGFFMLKERILDNNGAVSTPTMKVVSFSNVSQCSSFAAINPDFKSINCNKLSVQAHEKSEQTGGAWIMLNGENGKICYNIPKMDGFSVIKQKNGDKAFSIPLYYVKHIDLSKPGLYFPSGHQASLNNDETKTMQNIAIYNKRSDVCN